MRSAPVYVASAMPVGACACVNVGADRAAAASASINARRVRQIRWCCCCISSLLKSCIAYRVSFLFFLDRRALQEELRPDLLPFLLFVEHDRRIDHLVLELVERAVHREARRHATALLD